MELIIGIKNTLEDIVTVEKTAANMGSGMLEVYATPCMIALMEMTSCTSVESYMDEGYGTVGTYLDVKHLAASPVGAHITCESELVEIDGRRLVFTVKASDDCGIIGEGRHERFIINNEKFMTKTNAKIGLNKDYTSEARATWGDTDAYKEYEQKSAGRSAEQEQEYGTQLMNIFSEFGNHRDKAPESDDIQNLVKNLQSFITDHYYKCTNEILVGLGKMYVAGGEMTDNIDNCAGQGTAAFVNKAIENYVTR